MQVFNEEIAPIKGAALAVKREHERTEGDEGGGRTHGEKRLKERPSQEKWAHWVASRHRVEEQTKSENKDDTG